MKEPQFSEIQKKLIVDNRLSATRLVRSLLRRYNYSLPREEIQSIADAALCEAARKFDPDRGTAFMSYLFLFLKGTLMTEIRGNHRYYTFSRPRSGIPNLGHTEIKSEFNGHIKNFDPDLLADDSDSPEESFRLYELRVICREALESLQPLERNTIIGIDILESSVTKFAQHIGYSRPYLSALRKRAIQKMQPYFEKIAA